MKFNFSTYDLQVVDASTQTLTGILLDKGFGVRHFIPRTSQEKLVSLKFKEFGPLAILEYAVGVPVQINASHAANAYFLNVILAGHSIEQSQYGKRVLKAGDSTFVMPKTHFTSNDSAGCKKLIVRVSADFLHQTVREFGYLSSINPVQFASEVSKFPIAGPLFNLLNDILQQDKRELNERARFYYCRLLNSAIFTMFDITISQGSLSNNSLHRHVERVRNYVLDNITADIKIDELAKVCQISRKSLYNIFERETGLTPSAYIRRLKLESIHSELKNNEHVRNVTQVALEYGFTNLGRFSAQYREQIGELPSQTLRHFTH